jgi:spore germination cell wall hydrolase CwlJ-like protein
MRKILMNGSSDSIDTLARTIWGEARGCGAAGMRHVANVIVNRANHPAWWGNGIIGACLQPWQFSCRNPGDPNRVKLLAVTATDPDFALALGIARQAVAGKLPDATGGADSYYALSMKMPPPWAAKAVRTFADGWHAFFRTTAAVHSGATLDARAVSVHAAASADTETAALNASEMRSLNPTTENST